jgi:hypothetical protein
MTSREILSVFRKLGLGSEESRSSFRTLAHCGRPDDSEEATFFVVADTHTDLDEQTENRAEVDAELE